MNIWNIQNINWDQLRLWRIDKGNFRVSEAGSYTPLLNNPTYILIEKVFAPVFEQLSKQVSVNSVVIHDLLRNTTNHDYVELKVTNSIDTESIHTFDAFGLQVWAYNGNLFVSCDLKHERQSIGREMLEFHLGFSMFG